MFMFVSCTNYPYEVHLRFTGKIAILHIQTVKHLVQLAPPCSLASVFAVCLCSLCNTVT